MIELKREILRKSIHFSGLVYIPVYQILGHELMIIALAFTIALLLPFEALRLRKGYFKAIVRDYEEKKVGAYFYFLLAMFLVTIFFPRDSCFVALVTSIVGDGASGIVKRAFGSNLASTVMLVSSLLVLALLNLLDFASFIAVLCGTLAERVRKLGRFYVQDNMSVPLVTAFSHHSVKYISASVSF